MRSVRYRPSGHFPRIEESLRIAAHLRDTRHRHEQPAITLRRSRAHAERTAPPARCRRYRATSLELSGLHIEVPCAAGSIRTARRNHVTMAIGRPCIAIIGARHFAGTSRAAGVFDVPVRRGRGQTSASVRNGGTGAVVFAAGRREEREAVAFIEAHIQMDSSSPHDARSSCGRALAAGILNHRMSPAVPLRSTSATYTSLSGFHWK